MERIEEHVMGGFYGVACRELEALLKWRSDPKGGMHYLLGSCELARGRKPAAAVAWEKVRPGSEFAEKGVRGRLRLLHDLGRIADAEQLVLDAANDPRNDRTAIMILLVPILIDLGRSEEAAGLIEDRWGVLNAQGQGALESAVKLVRQHIDVTMKLPAVQAVRSLLDEAGKLAPSDDRIWLGRANLAIRLGEIDEAQRWLVECEKARPRDLPVWRARLKWGTAAKRPEVVRRALEQEAAKQLEPRERHRVNAWLARQDGDAGAERRELEAVCGDGHGAGAEFERLAELAEKAGDEPAAREWRGRKVEFDQRLERYLKRHERRQPIRDAAELTHLAKQLGRDFESRVFEAIASEQERSGGGLNSVALMGSIGLP
jgi:tetratricopeptide (TPR) repeat protein